MVLSKGMASLCCYENRQEGTRTDGGHQWEAAAAIRVSKELAPPLREELWQGREAGSLRMRCIIEPEDLEAERLEQAGPRVILCSSWPRTLGTRGTNSQASPCLGLRYVTHVVLILRHLEALLTPAEPPIPGWPISRDYK